MKCKKHQWDYVGNYRIGEDIIMMNRPKYAKWICPYCEEEKLVNISKNE
ncbi:hypothetical protein LCGC14_1860560 [marine sediment metagenome]|uniref:Uncharacterized protein n=1 Tax=marine sediment metagenome TaxID=412755 RepID=A0A0F9GW34_9ZZZZ